MRKLYLLIILVLATSRFFAQTFTNYTKASSLLCNDTVFTIAFDEHGNTWFGTANGVSEFDGINWKTYNKTDGLADNSVTCMTIDPYGNKWFGTYNGISKFTDSAWTTYLQPGFYTSIKMDAKNNVWVTSGPRPSSAPDPSGTVLAKFDGVNWEPITDYDDPFWSIAIDSMDNKWFSTYDFVIKYDDITWASFHGGMGSCNYSIALDKNGNVWTSDGYRFDGNEFIQILKDGMLGDFYFQTRAIAIDSKNNKWFGTDTSGVWKYNDTIWTHYTTKNGLVNNHVISVAIDAEDNIWFGTLGGVSKLVDSEVTQIKETNFFDVKFYPVPVTDKLSVSFSKPITQTIIEIFTIDGIKLCSLPIYSNTIELDMSKYPSGAYIVRINSLNEGIITKQIIKAGN
jgi:streptogramin lyase